MKPAGRTAFFLTATLVLAVTAVSYLPVLGNDFINWDDDVYVRMNLAIREISWARTRIFFTSFFQGNYHPLTLLAHALEYRLFVLDPLAYHAVNLGLHLANCLLVLLVLRFLSLGLPAAALGALLFGVHPLHVESVVWISELKDVLSAFFFLAALAVWLRRRATGAGGGLYWSSLLLFLLALLAKAMAISFPLVLLLCDYLAGRRPDRSSLGEKVPFFLLSAAFGLVALAGQSSVVRTGQEFPLYEGIFVASHGFLLYLAKMVAPVGLSALYPYPLKTGTALPRAFLLAPIPAILLVGAFFLMLRRNRRAVFGGLFFLVTLAPVSQIVPFGYAAAADRYTYLPSIGLIYLLAVGFERLLPAGSRIARGLLWALPAAAVILLSGQTWRRTLVWRESLTFWNDVISRYPDHPLPYNLRGNVQIERHRYAEAFRDLNRSIELGGTMYNNAQAYFNRGSLYHALGDQRKALADYTTALELAPDYADAYNNRGNAHDLLNEPEKAIADYDRALAHSPDNHLYLYNRGYAYQGMGKYDLAIADFSRSIASYQENAAAWYNRGYCRLKKGETDAAVADFNRALEIDPSNVLAVFNRGNIHAEQGRHDAAVADFTRVLELRPDNAQAAYNRGKIYRQMGDARRAIEDFDLTLRLRPDQAEAWNNRGALLAQEGKLSEAIADFTRAVELKPDYAYAFYNRGRAYIELAEPGPAVADFDRAVSLQPGENDYLLARALAYASLGNRESARRDILRLLGRGVMVDKKLIRELGITNH